MHSYLLYSSNKILADQKVQIRNILSTERWQAGQLVAPTCVWLRTLGAEAGRLRVPDPSELHAEIPPSQKTNQDPKQKHHHQKSH